MRGVKQLERFCDPVAQGLRLPRVAAAGHGPIHYDFANIAGDQERSQDLGAMLDAIEDVHVVLAVDLDPTGAGAQPHLRHTALALPDSVREALLVHDALVDDRRR